MQGMNKISNLSTRINKKQRSIIRHKHKPNNSGNGNVCLKYVYQGSRMVNLSHCKLAGSIFGTLFYFLLAETTLLTLQSTLYYTRTVLVILDTAQNYVYKYKYFTNTLTYMVHKYHFKQDKKWGPKNRFDQCAMEQVNHQGIVKTKQWQTMPNKNKIEDYC